MSPKEIRNTYNTLDKACTRIEELETEREQTHIFKTATAAPAPRPAPPSRPTPKPSPKPSSVPQPPRRVEDLDTPALMAAMDIAAKQGATETVKDLYAELNRRRAELKG